MTQIRRTIIQLLCRRTNYSTAFLQVGLLQFSTQAAEHCTQKSVFGRAGQCNFELQQRHFFSGIVRLKSNKRPPREEETDSENEDDSEFKDERDSKVVRAKVNSLRTDLLLKSGLGMARNKIEAIFYDSKIRVNGLKLQKKSVQLNIGDEIDVIKGFSQANPSHLVIARVVILSASTGEREGLNVTLRRYKSLLIENYSGLNVYKSSAVSNH